MRPHVRGADRLAARRGYVPGAVAFGQGLVYHQFKGGRFLGQTQGIAQHHGYAEDRGDGVGDVLAGDVRGCAVDRLVETADSLARYRDLRQAGRRQQSHGRGQHRRLISQNVSECVLGYYDVEPPGIANQLHCAGVHQDVLQLHVGVLGGQPGGYLAPQPGALQYIGFVHGSQLSLPALGQLEPHPQDAFNLGFAVPHSVDGGQALGRLAPPLGQSVIQPAGQLSDNYQVHPFEHRRLQRAGVGQPRICLYRANVGEYPKVGA